MSQHIEDSKNLQESSFPVENIEIENLEIENLSREISVVLESMQILLDKALVKPLLYDTDYLILWNRYMYLSTAIKNIQMKNISTSEKH